jgi:hypothetical protein
MRMIITLSLLIITVFKSTAQTFEIGTKESFKRYKSELKAPYFLDILKKSKQPVKIDSTEIITFNGFSDQNTQRCSFDVHTFRKSTYKYENEQFEYLDSVRSVKYIYQNQKIVYKEVWLKKNGRYAIAHEVYYYKNGKPKSFYSYLSKIRWYFDKRENVVDKFDHSDLENEENRIVLIDNSKFTLEEHLKIREELKKITKNFEYGDRFDWQENTVNDWETLNKTKKYLKKLFKTDIDLYYEGMSEYDTYFISEYGDSYVLSPHWEKYRDYQINSKTE